MGTGKILALRMKVEFKFHLKMIYTISVNTAKVAVQEETGERKEKTGVRRCRSR
jgi:hypothetical protein